MNNVTAQASRTTRSNTKQQTTNSRPKVLTRSEEGRRVQSAGPPEVMPSSSAATTLATNETIRCISVLQKKVELLESANATNTSTIRGLERRTNQLQQTINQMEEDRKAKEGLKKNKSFGRNNAMSSTIRLAYDAYLEDDAVNEEATGWSFISSFMESSKNQEITAYIRERIIAEGGCVGAGPRLSRAEEDEILYRVRNFFNDQKAKDQQSRLPEEEKKKMLNIKKMNTRRDRKLKWRKAAYNACREQLDDGQFGTPEEQKAMLNTKYFSEDEDGEFDETRNRLLEFQVMTPSWRSTKLNKFYQQLDEIHESELRKHSNDCLHRNRVYTTMWKLTDLEVAALPHWCVEGREDYYD
ncbi:hypothetical protein MAM1_0150c06622 [Mucor ambiguus]|uniref:Uncharacterized protein n=1 Tax=Mucor ambiguus TaxID=91626 RepID=A0A0C9LVP4_9FUNG|nr:hypothetical protein MAM1_0150c06622 [Mucor ambiguus]